MGKSYRAKPIPADKLRLNINPKSLGFETTADLRPFQGTFGQDRAIDALSLGLGVEGKGFNIFLTGEPGTGKTSIIMRLLQDLRRKFDPPSDWCYVHNFDDPDHPKALEFPAGDGSSFRSDMYDMIAELKRRIPKIKESDSYIKERQNLDLYYHEKDVNLFEKLRRKAKKLDLDLDIIDDDLVVRMIENGETLSIEDMEELPEEKRREFEERIMKLQESVEKFAYAQQKLSKEHDEKLSELDKKNVLKVCKDNLDAMRKRYGSVSGVNEYLNRVEQEIPAVIISYINQSEGGDDDFLMGLFSSAAAGDPEDSLLPFKVNLFVNNAKTKGAPIVVENSPTYQNLIGRVEYKEQSGWLSTDFMQIKPGALHRANGGFIVIQAIDLLRNPFSWDALKRALRSKQIEIQNPAMDTNARILKTLRPEAIPLNVKVVLVGSEETYYWLWEMDEDFSRLFKVRADFDSSMPLSKQNINRLSRFIAKVANEEGRLHMSASGVARLIEEGSREVESQKRTTVKLSSLVDLFYESDFWAKQEKSDIIERKHVVRAINERIYRKSRLQDEFERQIREGSILIDTSGHAIGQINGIAVYSIGDYEFGVPSRITARAYTGRNGVINIERETNLAGPIHSKASLILQGFLGSLFATDKAFDLSVSITFEQVYGMVEGDSATCAELYAVLSAISGVPINQAISITGSHNQMGDVQPIGAVNAKIEGVFRICKARGLNGNQGVVIPAQNIENLALSDDVIEAVKKDMFRIYPISRVEDAVPILMGIPAGKKRNGKFYPKNSLFALVDEGLNRFRSNLKDN